MGLSGLGKLIKELATGTPADTDCFVFGNSDMKKITLPNLKKALGVTKNQEDIKALNSSLDSITLKYFVLAPGEYYYTGNFVFYKLGNLGVMLYTQDIILKNTGEINGKGWVTIGYIPKDVPKPAYPIYGEFTSQGKTVASLKLTTDGLIQVASDTLQNGLSPDITLFYCNF